MTQASKYDLVALILLVVPIAFLAFVLYSRRRLRLRMQQKTAQAQGANELHVLEARHYHPDAAEQEAANRPRERLRTEARGDGGEELPSYQAAGADEVVPVMVPDPLSVAVALPPPAVVRGAAPPPGYEQSPES